VATASSLKSEQENTRPEIGPEIGAPSRGQAFLWIGTATVTGAIVMAMELTAFRLYASYFANSIYVWGSMISVVMLALSVGYGLGGWIADRKPSDTVLYFIVLGSGVVSDGNCVRGAAGTDEAVGNRGTLLGRWRRR
jgi:hypothetical protein